MKLTAAPLLLVESAWIVDGSVQYRRRLVTQDIDGELLRVAAAEGMDDDVHDGGGRSSRRMNRQVRLEPLTPVTTVAAEPHEAPYNVIPNAECVSE